MKKKNTQQQTQLLRLNCSPPPSRDLRKSRPVSCFKRHYPHSFFPVFTRKHCCCLFACLSVPAQSEVLSKFTLRRLHHPGVGPDLTQRRVRAGSQGSVHSPGTRQHAAQPSSSLATSFPVGPWPLSGLALSPRLPLRLISFSPAPYGAKIQSNHDAVLFCAHLPALSQQVRGDVRHITVQ